MRQEIATRIAAVSAELEKLSRPLERDPQKEKIEAIEEASLEGAIACIDKLHKLTGLAPTPEAKQELALEIKKLLL